jgi:hypothetical protein
MARKHNLKRTRIKAAVQQILVTPATDERKVVTGADGAYTVIKGAPAVYKQGKALDTTKTKEFGNGSNDPKNMAPRGKAGQKS